MNVPRPRRYLSSNNTPERQMPLAWTMDGDVVLDTSALIAWPISELSGTLVVPEQQNELLRISPDRGAILDTLGVIFMRPSDSAMELTRDAAKKTGDMAGLSEIDLSLIALTQEKSAILVTDDYRMQNIATSMGLVWKSVGEDGITESWKWELRCIGCKTPQPAPDSPSRRRADYGNCPDCGSALRLKRIG